MGADDNRGMSTHSSTNTAFDGVVALADWGVIRAEGSDAASFLHAQLTQDIAALDAGSASLAGYCSPKGRLLASFVVARPSPDTVWLACSADLLPAVHKRLSMFVLRSKCRLTDATGELQVRGAAGSAAPPGLAPWQANGPWLGLPPAEGVGRALWIGPAAEAPDAPAWTPDAWAWLEVMSAVPRIQAATAEQFVPQMVNLELVGGVNFRKGCYPGQEVVARSQYRGTTKRRLSLWESPVSMHAGQEVFHSDDPGQPAGMVVLAASHAGRHAAQLELKLAAAERGQLHLGAADGPVLSRLPMPYALPTDADLAA